MKITYLDNNATTQVAPEVYEAMVPFLTEDYFNPSSMYEPARRTKNAIVAARKAIADALGHVDPREILFTGCATESNNTAIVGTAHGNPNRRHIITTSVEHPAVLEVCRELERDGYPVTYLGVDRAGNLDVKEFIRSLSHNTLLVSIMHANNETGVVFPIEQLSRITKQTDPSIIFHTDATQTVGKLPVDLTTGLPFVDLLSFSGHKLHAPKGIGALFIRRGTRCRPFMLGGHQEDGRRGGTENVAYIIGLSRALTLALERREEDEARIGRLRDRLENGLLETISSVQINGKDAPRLPNTLNISIHYIEGEGMLFQLSSFGICASSGSACTSGSLEPSHVLRAMKVPFTAVHGSVRFSLSRYTTDADIDKVLEVFPKIVNNLRKLSPYWDNEKNTPRPDALTLVR
ncbi:MAG: cysteine desulfurase NifS [Acidobacteria bacterium]|nr:cysteine desulfurase NifS [Acidobacteriota bacterium]